MNTIKAKDEGILTRKKMREIDGVSISEVCMGMYRIEPRSLLDGDSVPRFLCTKSCKQ